MHILPLRYVHNLPMRYMHILSIRLVHNLPMRYFLFILLLYVPSQQLRSWRMVSSPPSFINNNTGPPRAVGHMSVCRYMCLTANPGVTNSIPVWSRTFAGIDHEINSTAILLPSADSRRVVVSYKGMYVHKVFVNCLVKLASEKSVVR